MPRPATASWLVNNGPYPRQRNRRNQPDLASILTKSREKSNTRTILTGRILTYARLPKLGQHQYPKVAFSDLAAAKDHPAQGCSQLRRQNAVWITGPPCSHSGVNHAARQMSPIIRRLQ